MVCYNLIIHVALVYFSCVVRADPFYYTVLMPIVLVLSFNVTSIVAITLVLKRRARRFNSDSMRIKNRARIIFGFILLLGVTWTFGFLVISNDIVVFQYVFCILCCFKGLYMFLLYGIRKDKHRRCWRKLLRGHSISEISKILNKRSQRSFNTRSENGGGTIRERLVNNSSSNNLTSLTNLSLSSNDNKKTAVSSTIKIQLKNQTNTAHLLERGNSMPNPAQSIENLDKRTTGSSASMDNLLQ